MTMREPRLINLDGQSNGLTYEQRRLRSIWVAVFLQGLRDAALGFKILSQLQKKNPSAQIRHIMNDAARDGLLWVMDTESKHQGSFNGLCELLDRDPVVTRSKWRMRVRELLKD